MICYMPDRGPNEILSMGPRVRRDATGSIVKHTKSRHHSDHQKVFKLDFKKRWQPIKKDSLSAYQLILIVLDQFICYNIVYIYQYIYTIFFAICDPNKSV